MATERYRQVEIRRNFPDGRQEYQVCYLPAEFAVAGRKLEIRMQGQWNVGWVVATVYEAEVSSPIHVAGDIKDHRRATGDSSRKAASRK